MTVKGWKKGIGTFFKLSYLLLLHLLKIHHRLGLFLGGILKPCRNRIFLRIGAVIYLHLHDNTSVNLLRLYQDMRGREIALLFPAPSYSLYAKEGHAVMRGSSANFCRVTHQIVLFPFDHCLTNSKALAIIKKSDFILYDFVL